MEDKFAGCYNTILLGVTLPAPANFQPCKVKLRIWLGAHIKEQFRHLKNIGQSIWVETHLFSGEWDVHWRGQSIPLLELYTIVES